MTRLAFCLLLLSSACGAFRRPVTVSKEPVFRDGFLLDAEPANLIVEIDYLRGSKPEPSALRVLGRRLALYTGKTGTIEIRLDGVIPRKRWDGRRKTMRALVEKHADPPTDGSAYIYIMYLDKYKKFRGLSFQSGRLSGRFQHPLGFVYTDAIKPVLWVTRSRQEGAVLVHEVGHLMGLVTNPAHYTRAHCTNSWCLMYNGVDTRSILLHAVPTLFTGYLPTRFCRSCQKDLWVGGVLPGRKPKNRAKVRIIQRVKKEAG
jgi:hypothetical protein